MAFQLNETQEMPPSSDKHLCNGGSWSGFATRIFGGFINVKSKSSTGNASEIQVIKIDILSIQSASFEELPREYSSISVFVHRYYFEFPWLINSVSCHATRST